MIAALSEDGVITSTPLGASSRETSYQPQSPSYMSTELTSTSIDECLAVWLSRSSAASGIIGMMADAIITVIISRVLAVFAMCVFILSVLHYFLCVKVLELLRVVCCVLQPIC